MNLSHRSTKGVVLALAVCAASGFFVTCGTAPAVPSLPESPSRFNVIVIVVDALRADHLGTYGYSRDTSPFIDRLATQGVVFDQALANSSFTQESISTLLTGSLPSRSGSVGWGTAPAEALDTLGEYFARAGYRTGFFSNTPVLRHADFARGFEVAEILNRRWNESGGGLGLSHRALEFAEEHRDERFLMYLHYLDPHGPYAPDDAFYHRFSEEKFPEPVALYSEVRNNCQKLVDEGFGTGDPRYEDMVLRYDAEIAFVDHAIGDLYEGLENAGLSDSTMIVITSDHGEEFLEHGFVEHAWTLYREVLHVPLIFWAPGADPGRVADRVSTVDLLPSLLELNAIPYPARELDGQALFRKQDGVFVPGREPGVHVAELLIQDRNQIRTLIHGDWKYVAAWKWLTPAERSVAPAGGRATVSGVWGPPVREELYHTARDPEEQHDLSAEHADVIARFRSYLENYRRFCAPTPGSGPTLRELSDEDREALRSLGYL